MKKTVLVTCLCLFSANLAHAMGELMPIPESTWVTPIVDLGGYTALTSESCVIREGEHLKVKIPFGSFFNPHLLVQYSPEKPETHASECPAGTTFEMKLETLREYREKYAAKLADRQELKIQLDALIRKSSFQGPVIENTKLMWVTNARKIIGYTGNRGRERLIDVQPCIVKANTFSMVMGELSNKYKVMRYIPNERNGGTECPIDTMYLLKDGEPVDFN